MENFVIYCKSFSRDLNRALILAESVEKYNKDNIPFYISVPSTELSLFRNKLPNSVNLISDADILGSDINQSWVTQQVVKSSFWKTNICENYLMVDSDSYFISDFGIDTFMYNESTPYTVCHEQKDLWNWSVRYINKLGFNPKDSFVQDRNSIMAMFGRTGRVLDFGPGPVIWSKKVWMVLDQVMEENNLTWNDLMRMVPSEFTWYGEALLFSKVIDLFPIEPPFKFFHYHQQYLESKNMGITEYHLSQNYIGITLQSNWQNSVEKY
jgi:hypothetical protein